jgi:hypothetical protein
MKLFVLGLVLSLGACVGMRTTIKAEFTPIGIVGNGSAAATIVASASEVQVFYASSPAGFSLRENELTVEPGYGHRILGIVKLQLRQNGACWLTQKDALSSLQRGAYLSGANAVVYATSPLAQTANETSCLNAAQESNFGSGWAVVLGSSAPAAPAAPAPATPTKP